MRQKGLALILVIILIVVAGIIILGTSFFIREQMMLGLVRVYETEALGAAAAGIFSAIAEYQNDGNMNEYTDVSLGGNKSYSVGGSGMFFLADCSNPTIIADRKIKDVSMTNLNSTEDVTITHMQVSWAPDGGENIISIDLGRGTVEWSGSEPSGTNIDMADYTIPADSTENDVWLDWETGSHISSMTITAIITFSDDSTVEVTFLNAGSAGNNASIITSTGKVESNVTWKRTLKVGYDVSSNEIVSWEESLDHL